MKSSSTSRNVTFWPRCLRLSLVVVHLTAWAGAAAGADADGTRSPYKRQDWGPAQGFAGGSVQAIAETADGYLWIGCDKGLVRFDGVSFRVFTEMNSQGLSPGSIQGLTSDVRGDLFIRQQNMSLFRYRVGSLQTALNRSLGWEGGVTAMCRGRNGEILVLARSKGILRYRGSGPETLLATSGIPNFLVISMAQTADGVIWLGTRDAGLFSLGPDRKLTSVPGLRDRKINSLLPVNGSELWIGTDSGAAHWNGRAMVSAGIPSFLEHAQVLAMLQDHKSNVWISTARGILRIDAKGVPVWEVPADASDGMVNALFEDREGDIWVGSNGGLARLRESPFYSYSGSADAPAQGNSPLYVDNALRTWSGARDGGLICERAGESKRVSIAGLDKDVVLSIAGRDGELWVGRRLGGLTHLRPRGASFGAETYTQAQGLAQDNVDAVYESSDEAVWAGTLTGGVSRFKDGHFTTYTEANGLASNTVTAIAEGQGGTMWFGGPRGLNEFSSKGWRLYGQRDGLPPGGVNCLLVDASGVLWIGTARGLALLRSGRLQTCKDPRGILQEEILGTARDRRGSLWVATTNHIVRLNYGKLLAGTLGPSDLREYGISDGLLGSGGVKRDRSVIADADGRIWISSMSGISVVDPAWLTDEAVPVLSHIEAISVDGTTLAPALAKAVEIPAGRKRIMIGYVGLCLSFPERVRFQYKLDGFDREWTKPNAEREAVYTNLEPGSYRFHVKASNAYGIWDSPEASLAIQMEPAFWQSWWFRLTCGLTVLLASMLSYRLRLKQIRQQLKVRFEERLAERTRIAQELHDTLLQGFLSASMQVHIARGRLPSDSPAVGPLNRAVELIEQASQEGRTTLRGLRSRQSDSLDLEQAFLCIPKELGTSDEVAFRVIVVGPQRLLQPVLRNEVYRIGREAVVNAFHHARARHIEVELDYAEEHFRLLVRDDGSGIDTELLQAGRDGHWGLAGMRERAQRVGAKLTFWSSAAAGTEVVLRVSAQIAYQSPRFNGSHRWLRAIFSHNLGNSD